MKSFSRGKRGLGASKGSRVNKDSMGRITSTSKKVGSTTYTQSYRGQGSKITQSSGGRTTVFGGAVKPHKFKLTKPKAPKAPKFSKPAKAPKSDNWWKSPMKVPKASKAYKAPRYSRSSGSGSSAGFFSIFTFLNPFRRSKEVDQSFDADSGPFPELEDYQVEQSFDADCGPFRELEDYQADQSRDGFDPFPKLGDCPIVEETYQEMVDRFNSRDAETGDQKERNGSNSHRIWYITLGPASNEDFLQLVAKGIIKADTLVWTKGMPEWRAARNTTLMQSLLPKPPPIPGSGV